MNPKGHPATLKSFKPGDIGNPEGRNQYTYRREAEKVFDRLLLETKGDAASRLEKIIDKAIELAEAGKPYALDQILKRILPPVQKFEIAAGKPRSERFIPTEDEQRTLKNEIRGNGKMLQ